MELTDGGVFTCHATNDPDGEHDNHFSVHVDCELNKCHGYAIVVINPSTTTMVATINDRLTTKRTLNAKQKTLSSGVGHSYSSLATTISTASALSVTARSTIDLSNNNRYSSVYDVSNEITTVEPSIDNTAAHSFSKSRQMPTPSYLPEKSKRRG